jgi:WD40 repeat protein/class 3 adenylate cyclase
VFVFYFTDIEGSTRLWEEHTADMGKVIARHDEIVRQQIEDAGGRITKHTGDGVTAAFEAGQPVDCALQTQKQFAAEPWGAIGRLRIRIGLHAGEAELHAGDYFGPPVNATARVMSAGWGDQILLTPEVKTISPLPPGADLRDLGQHLLKDVSAPQQILQLLHPDLSRLDFPPLRTLSGSSIQRSVQEQGQQFAGLDAPSMAVNLISVTLLPTMQGDLSPTSPALAANLGLLGDLGAPALQEFAAEFAQELRARQQDGETLSLVQIREQMQVQLLQRWQAGGESALALRSDTSRLLQAVDGVQAALEAATADLKETLAHGLSELGSSFQEFRWMLGNVRHTLDEMHTRQALQLSMQREQLDLQRQQLVKTNLLLRVQRARAAAPVMVDEDEGELPPAEVPCPYKGLAAFEPEDADVFFGREELVAELTARLAGSRFLAVVGSSGSGKSSVVRAGLLPALWQGALPGSDDWQTIILTPGAHPLEELAIRASLLRSISPGSLLADLRADPQALDLAIRQALADEPEPVQLLLVVDQFEEVFALCRDEAERQQFIDALIGAVESGDSRAVVVLTIRADFFGRCGDYPSLAARLRDNVLVGPLGEDELRAVIERPAEFVGLRLEPGLVDIIVRDVADEPGALPLLSHALLETWHRRRGRTLTMAGYAESGGVAGAIAQTADSVYAALPEEQKHIARMTFLRLTELGEEGTQDTRRRVSPEELVLRPDEAKPVQQVLKTLADARLITTGEETVEVAHEALIREWPVLRQWLEEDREGLRIHRHLTDTAQEWERLERDPSELYRGARLAAVLEWSEEHAGELNPLEREFVEASHEAVQREALEREAARQRELEQALALAEEQEKRAEEQALASSRIRRGAWLLAGAAVIAVVLAVLAFLARQSATQNASAAQAASTVAVAERDAAETAQVQEASQRATAQAETLARATAEAVAVAERDTAETAQVQEASQRATAQAETLARATAEAVAILEREDARRQAAIGLASQAKLEMSGSQPERAVLLALAAVEDYPYTWQAEHALGEAVLNHRLLLDLPHDDFVDSAEVSPDGTRVTTMCDDTILRVWDAETGEQQLALTGHDSWLWGGTWSPSGDRILSSSYDRTARVYDAATGEVLHVLSGHGGFYSAWSPDGTRISTWYETEGTVTIWDAATGEVMFSLSHGEPSNRALSYDGWSPDGSRIVTAGRDQTARVWDAWTGEEQLVLTGHEATVVTAAFSPDGSRIVTGSWDGIARVWDATTGEHQLTLAGHASTPWPRWSPSGDRILTARDGLAIVWDASTGEQLHLFRCLPGSTSARWSPDGSMVAAGGAGGELTVWDSGRGVELAHIQVHPGDYRFQWFPDSERIITAGDEGYAKIWKVSTAQLRVSCEPDCHYFSTGWGTAPTWSPDGRYFATGYYGGLAVAWDAASGEEIWRLQYEQAGELMNGGVTYVDWSPTGDRFLTADGDGNIKIWDAATGDELLTFLASAEPLVTVIVARWSPDGTRIVSASEDGTAKVWDAIGGEMLLGFAEHAPLCVDWSSDGTRIVSGAEDGTAKVWDASTGTVLRDLMPEDFAFSVTGVAWSPDDGRIATFSADSLGRIWDAQTGEEVLQFSAPLRANPVFWSPSGDRLLTSGWPGAAQVWDAHSGREVLAIQQGVFTNAMWSPDGSLLAITDMSDNVQILPAWQTLDELIQYAREHAVVRELTDAEREQFGLDLE